MESTHGFPGLHVHGSFSGSMDSMGSKDFKDAKDSMKSMESVDSLECMETMNSSGSLFHVLRPLAAVHGDLVQH